MKWSDFKQEITSLTPEEKAQVARVENLSYIPSLTTLSKILGGLDMDIALVDRQTGEVLKV